MENKRIPHKAKVFLKLGCYKHGSLPPEHGKIYKTNWVIFNGHYPSLHYSIHVLLPHGSHVNEIHLNMVTKLRGNDGLLCTSPWRHSWLLLHAHIAILVVNLAQFMHGVIKRWLGWRKCFVNSQMAQSAMGLVYHIENSKHVDYDASSVFVNQNLLGGSIQKFALLNGEVLHIVVPLRMLSTEPVYSWGLHVVLRGCCKVLIISPMTEAQDHIIVLINRLDGLVLLEIIW